MSNPFELMSKADVMREYKYPLTLLDTDIRNGDIPAFLADGQKVTRKAYLYPGRYYIPRYGVERCIQERAEGSK